MEQMKKNNNDHDYALTHVHAKEKKGFFSMFVVMLGFYLLFRKYAYRRKPWNGITA